MTYIFAADSMGLPTFISLHVISLYFKVEHSKSKTASAKTEFYVK